MENHHLEHVNSSKYEDTKVHSTLDRYLMTEDGMQSQASRSGQNSDPTRSEDGPPVGSHASGGLGLLGQASSS